MPAQTASPTVRTFVLLCGILLLTGCPYDSEYPLGNVKNASIDRALIGEWELIPEKASENGALAIYPLGEKELLIVMREIRADRDDMEIMTAYASKIGEQMFLSARAVDFVPKKTWLLVSYALSGDSLKVRVVDEKLFTGRKIGSAGDLVAVIKPNLLNPELFVSEAGKPHELAFRRVLK